MGADRYSEPPAEIWPLPAATFQLLARQRLTAPAWAHSAAATGWELAAGVISGRGQGGSAAAPGCQVGGQDAAQLRNDVSKGWAVGGVLGPAAAHQCHVGIVHGGLGRLAGQGFQAGMASRSPLLTMNTSCAVDGESVASDGLNTGKRRVEYD